MTADPTRPGWAYAVWDMLIGPNANESSDIHSASFTDDTLVTRTTDFGATWSPVRVIKTARPGATPKRVSTPGGPAFTPVVAVSDSGSAGVGGTVGVTY